MVKKYIPKRIPKVINNVDEFLESIPSKPAPRKIKPTAVSEELIAKALISRKGLIYLAAEQLNLSHTTISERIQKSPYLQSVKDACIERRLDIAEINLAEMTEDKELGAICFLLKTKGKSRGYGENSQVLVSSEALDSLKTVMEQMKQIQPSRTIEESKVINDNKS